MLKGLYAVLGLSRRATKAEIKDAFKKLALRYHPDRNKDPEAVSRFEEISEAYAILSDGDKRARYDSLGPDGYDDPYENFRYDLEKEISRRQGWSGSDELKSAGQEYRDDSLQSILITLFLLLMWFLFLRGL